MKMFLDFFKTLKPKPKADEATTNASTVLTSSTGSASKKTNASKKATSKEDAEGPLGGEPVRSEGEEGTTPAVEGEDDDGSSEETIDSDEDSDSTIEAVSAQGLFGPDEDDEGEGDDTEAFGGLFGDDDDGGEKKEPAKAESPDKRRRFLRGRRKKDPEAKSDAAAKVPRTRAARRGGKGGKLATAFTPTASSAKATERLILELRELKKAMTPSASKPEPKSEEKEKEIETVKEQEKDKDKDKEPEVKKDETDKEALTSASAVVAAGEEVKSLEGFSVAPVGDNLYKWHVRFFDFDPSSQIFGDLAMYAEATGRAHVLLEVIFPGEYPDHPPFMRIVYPRFHQYTGHITIGGSVCVRDLTKTGWTPEYKLGPFLIMIRNLLVEGGALVDMDNAFNDYTEQEARDAFNRVAVQHGWTP